MGRRRVRMELIKNEKMRQSVFQKRKSCLFKKANELSTLCDVKAGIIIFGPKSNDEPEIWQGNISDIRELVDKYKSQPMDEKKKRSTDLSALLKEQMNKSEIALSKLRKQNNDALYPTWSDLYDDLSEEELRELVRAFDAKLEAARTRFDMLKGNYGVLDDLFIKSELQFDHGAVDHPQPLDQYQHAQYELEYLNSDSNLMENQMMMALMNNSSDCTDQFGGALSYLPPIDGRSFYYDPMIGMVEESVADHNSAPFMYTGTAGPSSYDQMSEFNMDYNHSSY